jgi:hypothetical protein
MSANDRDEGLARLLRAGYDAPPPRQPFADGLMERLRGQLRAQRSQTGVRTVIRILTRNRRLMAAAAAVLVVAAGLAILAQRHGGVQQEDTPGFVGPQPESTPEASRPRMVPLEVRLPPAEFTETPRNIPPSPYLEKYSQTPRPPLPVPEGTANVASAKRVTASDSEPVVGQLWYLTDGNKVTQEGFLEIGPGKQWVQIDLGASCSIHAICVWHYHAVARVYHDVVVQVAEDPDFIDNVRTVYNNDYDNSSGLGVGKDLEYVEDYRGRLIPAGGVQARYVRLYSKGNSENDLNHYVEVEVFGQPAPSASAKDAPVNAPPRAEPSKPGLR